MGEGLHTVCYETDTDSKFSADRVHVNIPLDAKRSCDKNFTFMLSFQCKAAPFEGSIGLTLQ